MSIAKYDRLGQSLTLLEWAALLELKTYKRVAETTLPNGKWVSTVWLGLDCSFGDRPPLIFETMVFPSKEQLDELDIERYATEEEAREGHTCMVEKWSKCQETPVVLETLGQD